MKTVKIFDKRMRGDREFVAIKATEARCPETTDEAISLLGHQYEPADHIRRGMERSLALNWLRTHVADDDRAFKVYVAECLDMTRGTK